MDDTQYFDIEDDGTFRCPHCDLSYSFEIGIICCICDERLCPECYTGNHLMDPEHRANLQREIREAQSLQSIARLTNGP